MIKKKENWNTKNGKEAEMKSDRIIIDISESIDKDCAIYAVYAGLRMFYESNHRVKEEGKFNIAQAEAYCMLGFLYEKYPKDYKECEIEYDKIFKTKASFSFLPPEPLSTEAITTESKMEL